MKHFLRDVLAGFLASLLAAVAAHFLSLSRSCPGRSGMLPVKRTGKKPLGGHQAASFSRYSIGESWPSLF